MLTNAFCVRGIFLEKEPHTHSPPPLSVVGVSNRGFLLEEAYYLKLSLFQGIEYLL
jgi:hypothetical protein